MCARRSSEGLHGASAWTIFPNRVHSRDFTRERGEYGSVFANNDSGLVSQGGNPDRSILDDHPVLFVRRSTVPRGVCKNRRIETFRASRVPRRNDKRPSGRVSTDRVLERTKKFPRKVSARTHIHTHARCNAFTVNYNRTTDIAFSGRSHDEVSQTPCPVKCSFTIFK